MLRKIIAGLVIVLCALMLGLSIAAIGLIWINKTPFTQAATSQLQAVDQQLAQAQTTLKAAKVELERTLRIVDDAEKSMTLLKNQFSQAKALFGMVNGTLGDQLIPSLKASRGRIDQARTSLLQLKNTLNSLNANPIISLNLPGDTILADLIASAGSLDTQIAQVQDLVTTASTFLNDSSYIMGADFSETRVSLQNFLSVVTEYDGKLAGWRAQIDYVVKSLPVWVNTAAICLTIFLGWLGISQISLIQQALVFRRGGV